jgi:hypothetical protein
MPEQFAETTLQNEPIPENEHPTAPAPEPIGDPVDSLALVLRKTEQAKQNTHQCDAVPSLSHREEPLTNDPQLTTDNQQLTTKLATRHSSLATEDSPLATRH